LTNISNYANIFNSQIKQKSMSEKLPSPQSGTEPVSADKPEKKPKKSDTQIAEQVSRISGKLIKRANETFMDGPYEVKLWSNGEGQRIRSDDNSVSQMFGEWGSDGSTHVTRHGDETILQDIGPEPVSFLFEDETNVQIKPNGITGTRFKAGWGDDQKLDQLGRQEAVSAAAKILSSTRNGISTIRQQRTKK
jgi:hypothetical protein